MRLRRVDDEERDTDSLPTSNGNRDHQPRFESGVPSISSARTVVDGHHLSGRGQREVQSEITARSSITTARLVMQICLQAERYDSHDMERSCSSRGRQRRDREARLFASQRHEQNQTEAAERSLASRSGKSPSSRLRAPSSPSSRMSPVDRMRSESLSEDDRTSHLCRCLRNLFRDGRNGCARGADRGENVVGSRQADFHH